MNFDGCGLQINDAQLALYGENVARLLNVSGTIHGSAISAELQKSLKTLRKRSSLLSAKYKSNDVPPPKYEWLLDNNYLAQSEGLSCLNDLRGVGKLPRSRDTAALFSLCLSLVRAGGGKISRSRCGIFLAGCQSVYSLSRLELSLFVPLLKAALISELALLYSEDGENAAEAEAAGVLFSSLRKTATLDYSDVLEKADQTEQILRRDPAEIYPFMSEKTREHYKKQVEALAKANAVPETSVAERVLKLARAAGGDARHVGYFLFTKPLGDAPAKRSGAIYIGINFGLSLLLSLFFAVVFDNPAVFLLSLLPFSQLVKSLLDFFLLRVTPPAHIPRMELENAVPQVGRSICVISALLTGEKSGENLARRLEQFRLASRDAGSNLLFGILADLPDADSGETPEDEKFINGAKNAIDALNQKYGGGFFFFIRPRSYSKSEKRFMAWERKRGAIISLARLLEGKSTELSCVCGSLLALRGTRFILTLDEDTRLTPGTARELIAAMLHPLNRAIVDEKRKIVVAGHGIIHPRMTVELSSCNKSAFSKIFAPQGGSDPYGSDSGELYMDVFENGGFAGKGIIDAHALLACCDNSIPENLVLSHDALEGAYLRGGYMGDAELSDSFPPKVLSYYRRLHRWTRGDWQNSPWLFSRGKSFSPLDRFRLFDSLRRSLLPPFCFFAIIAAFLFPVSGLNFAAFMALLALLLPLVFSAVETLFRDEREVKIRCYSSLVRGFGGTLLRSLLGLILLPYEAYICLCAAVSALWRMLISHKKLLNWTPASALSGGNSGVLKHFAELWFCPALGLLLCLFAPSILGKAAGIIWIFTPLCALSLSKDTAPKPSVSAEDRGYLLRCGKQIWSFFEAFCTAEDHFLPPDNFQERPPVGLAHRTSPTNIGLCLVSCISAIDLGLTRRETALGIIENILATLKRMPKWRGHLYNWYDTRSLKPLHPNYVSTVDSGNLAACLIIVREGLLELQETRLAELCDALLTPMSFAPLYDENHRLFSIGFDTEKNEKTAGCYDLMCSEARTAGFIAIARGDIPRKHWRYLSRAMVQKDGYRGMVSWTGTMFEYLMPRLFFASHPGSLMYESLHFCVSVQKKRCAPLKLPWGISECAFYALDPALNYRYKAHGCGALALKRNMDSELVVSPYSSFLALCCGAKSAVQNLRRLEKYAPPGGFGFWEAVDFTKGRVGGNRGETVRCVMSHHLGMSLAAIANCLCDDPLPRRLMADPAMAAHGGLLDEKLPLGGVLLRNRGQTAQKKPPKSSAVYWERRGQFADFEAPACALLSNGQYNVMSTDCGISHSRFGEIMPYFTSRDALSTKHGVELWLSREGELFSLLPTPDMDKSTKCNWEFTLSGAKYSLETREMRAQLLLSVSGNVNGEKRVISVSPKSSIEQSCQLIFMFEPVLASYQDYVNHPAFYRLGLHAKMRDGSLIIRRLARGKTAESFLCLSASVPLKISAHRELVPGRGGLAAAINKGIPSPLGWLSDPYICAQAEIRLAPGADSAVTLVLALGADENEAYSAACQMLVGDGGDASAFPAALAARLSMNDRQVSDAMMLLDTLAYPAPPKAENVVSKTQLWRFGISGDLPIFCHDFDLNQPPEETIALMKQHAFFAALGQSYDLVFITAEGGSYLRPAGNALSEMKRLHGGENPHIHIIDAGNEANVLRLAAALPRPRGLEAPKEQYFMSTDLCSKSQEYPLYNWNSDNSFTFYVNHSLPPRAWGNMLTNGSFGFFATDCGTGHMWFKNARELPINRWLCDPLATVGTEALVLDTPPRRSLFATADDENCEVTFGFGYAQWKKKIGDFSIKTTAFVPMDTDARVLIVEWEGEESLPLSWHSDIVLCADDREGSRVSISHENGVFTAHCPDFPFPETPFKVCSSASPQGFTTSRRAWFSAAPDGDCSETGFLGISFKAESPFILVCGCDEQEKLRELCDFHNANAAKRRTLAHWQSRVSGLKIKTPLRSLDRLVNGWLPYQTLACRLLGRCSIYQSGGAFGFRDQLQDAVNLILLDPAPAKAQILNCCRHQYLEGDVMHWWHELGETSRGVRTRCSDDLLWLGWALCEYLEKTGDTSLCEQKEPWLKSEVLGDNEHDRYEKAEFTQETASVLEHAQRALELVLSRGTGQHQLLKIGGGDWNDGMSEVGAGGSGESVWLSWFCSNVASRFAKILESLGKNQDCEKFRAAAIALGQSADKAWDGKWFRRGYFDNGSSLGSEKDRCCQIDSTAQSFAALCPEASKKHLNIALSSAVERLLDRENKLVSLFDPPFENADPKPGYIESYGPGFRENGGQYTHGAIFLAMALLKENRPDDALELLSALLPDNRDGKIYEAEPFVLAADVYSCPDCPGKAGWSWYTGAAGWMFRVVSEDLLGIKPENGKLIVAPRLPKGWEGCKASLNG
ncbi:MAG: glucoamylase family protein, partial [Oscillospiraceae bacterium]